jgi:mannose-1-phosphate guanylyltransferase / mannose-6-phosphate isomerase
VAGPPPPMRILLMAGGGGTRLWPLSTDARPKQFLPLLSKKSLLAETWDRISPASRDVWVATSARHADLVAKELPDLPADRILAEPARRNSGPAILAAALRFAEDGDPVVATVPTDQTVGDPEAFRRALAAAGARAEEASVVILAVPPTRPETDFGYFEVRDGKVLSFVEKPEAEKARALASSGRHFWNAGLFVFRPSRFLAEARRVAGRLVEGIEAYLRSRSTADYERLPDISIDFAVMEKAAGVGAVPLDAGWSDVGTWRQVRDLRGVSADGNLVIAENGRPVLAPGVRDSAIVAGPEGILVLPFDREGELKPAVERLRSGRDREAGEEAGHRNR